MSLTLIDDEILEVRKFALQLAKQNAAMDKESDRVVADAEAFEAYLIRDAEA